MYIICQNTTGNNDLWSESSKNQRHSKKKRKSVPFKMMAVFYGWDFFIRSNFLRVYKMTEMSLILLASIEFDFFSICFFCLVLWNLANHNGKLGCFGYGNLNAIFSYNLIVNWWRYFIEVFRQLGDPCFHKGILGHFQILVGLINN